MRLDRAYRAPAGTDLFELITAARAALDPVRDQLDAAQLAARAVAAVDHAAATGADLPVHPLFEALTGWDEQQAHLDVNDARRDPYRFELTIARDPDSGDLGIVAWCENDALLDAFTAAGLADPFPYWGNTDAPADVTAEQWSARYGFWDRCGALTGAPAEKMLRWTLRVEGNPGALTLIMVDGETGGPHPLILAALPDATARARQIAAGFVTRAGAALGAVTHRNLRTFIATTNYPDVVTAATDVVVDLDPRYLLGRAPAPSLSDGDARRARVQRVAEVAATDIATR